MAALTDRDWPDEPTRLTEAEQADLAEELSEPWELTGEETLVGEFSFPDFETALAFTQEVGALAEQVWHHPEITLTWGAVEVQLQTHDVGGLSEYDFILAARIDELYD